MTWLAKLWLGLERGEQGERDQYLDTHSVDIFFNLKDKEKNATGIQVENRLFSKAPQIRLAQTSPKHSTPGGSGPPPTEFWEEPSILWQFYLTKLSFRSAENRNSFSDTQSTRMPLPKCSLKVFKAMVPLTKERINTRTPKSRKFGWHKSCAAKGRKWLIWL